MLSHVTNQVKEKVEGLRARFQIGNLAPTLSAKNAEKDGAAAWLEERRYAGRPLPVL
jgi:hypothetical protein